MNIAIRHARIRRGAFALAAEGDFTEGVHLVTGGVGSGKSTLALTLAGLLQPEAGGVEHRGIGSRMMVFQLPEFHITGSTLCAECRSWGADPDTVLASAGLRDRMNEDPFCLSRGELRRLVLACVLSRPYDLLILDEPFSSLDCREREQLAGALSRQPAGIVIVLTHEQTFLPRVDRLWEITDSSLRDLGEIPAAIMHWDRAPPVVKELVKRGKIPANISREDLREAACRT